MKTHLVKADGIELATEAFGDPSHTPVLLIMGAMASMLWWSEEFCRRLAAEGRYVIRYDNRDTGLSSTYPPGAPSYTMDDMAEDAFRILDAHGIDKAHLVGMSLGGMIGQLAALAHPGRVLSFTAISTSPMGIDTSGLPGMSAAYQEHAASGEAVDWTDQDQMIDFIVRDTRALAGTRHPYDEAAARALIERDAARSRDFISATNHFMLKGGETWQGKLAGMKPPLLVIHGTSDPVFPIEHGRLLAETVPGARLMEIDGGGHEIHPEDWDAVISALSAQTR
ncbi:alpha/beta fold hydrolase [Nitratireductor pacificus]|nr:alpha/beta hydrolase [Nitratireductor pacificus]